MPRINLLPWREQERKVRRREFMVAAGAAVFAAVIFVLGGKLLYSSWTDAQNEKNALLHKEIVKLDAQIADIQDLDNPVLQVVESAKESSTGGSNFTLTSDVVGVDLEHGGETTVKKVAAK